MSSALKKMLVEKPWGRDVLPRPFAQVDGQRVGEIWFDAAHSELLVKYIFTSEKLSVQLHPTDEQTLARGLGKQGKDECWLIIDACHGAEVAIGFNERYDRTGIEIAARDGSIEGKLRWFPVRAGDFFYIPANTVHAIGEGVMLLEIQQNSDLTYRLFDHGRGRDLHLDEALPIADLGPYDRSLHRQLPPRGNMTLVEGPRFRLDRLDRLDGPPPAAIAERYGGRPVFVIPLVRQCFIGQTTLAPGDCGIASDLGDIRLEPSAIALIAQPVRD